MIIIVQGNDHKHSNFKIGNECKSFHTIDIAFYLVAFVYMHLYSF